MRSPLKSIEGRRQVSLMLCVIKDDVTSQPEAWIRSEIGSKQGSIPELQHWSLPSCHVSAHGNRTVCRFYSQTRRELQRAQCHIRSQFSPTISFLRNGVGSAGGGSRSRNGWVEQLPYLGGGSNSALSPMETIIPHHPCTTSKGSFFLALGWQVRSEKL